MLKPVRKTFLFQKKKKIRERTFWVFIQFNISNGNYFIQLSLIHTINYIYLKNLIYLIAIKKKCIQNTC